MRIYIIAMLISALCIGCAPDDSGRTTKHRNPNDKICIIEYVDGETERIRCWNAYISRPIFGGPTMLHIHQVFSGTQEKSLSTIKRWKIIKIKESDK